MSRFAGKIALVSSGRSGIGQAIARRLAAEAARVFPAQRGKDAEHEGIETDFTHPECPARLVAWLASNAAGFVTGQVWTVDGGRMAKLSLP